MTSRTSGFDDAGPAPFVFRQSRRRAARAFFHSGRFRMVRVVVGLLETAIIVLRKRYVDVNHFYGMSRHFVWLVPLIDLRYSWFSAYFCLWWSGVVTGPKDGARGPWGRSHCFLFSGRRFPGSMVRRFTVAMGLAARLVPALERRAGGFARLVR